MKASSLLLGTTITLLACAQGACDNKGFGHVQGGPKIEVRLVETPLGRIDDPEGDNEKLLGSRLSPLDLVVGTPQQFKIVVRALDKNGNPDASYNGYVRISAKPGAITPIVGDGGDGRNLKLNAGESGEVAVGVTNAYGTTYILADDIGYVPSDPLADARPQCSNGIDDDHDGKIDFPVDEGCAFANDDTEAGGSYEEGVSAAIFYRFPRIADARGVVCTMGTDGSVNCAGSGKTPYAREQLFFDTGYHDKRNKDGDIVQAFEFDTVVTRIASSGFYVTDVSDTRGFNSIFAFNFNSPPNMRVCDRIKTFAGTASEFFGLTQVSYPTWTLEEWYPRKDGPPCVVPEPRVLSTIDISPVTMLPLTASLVRVQLQTDKDGKPIGHVYVTPKFGPGFMPCLDELSKPLELDKCLANEKSRFVPGWKPDDKAPEPGTSCDFNKDGNIDFYPPGLVKEGECNNACAADPECTEYSNFVGRSTFRLTVTDGNGDKAAIQADSTTDATFHPLDMKGKELKSFTGTLTYFSGGAQYTIEARCSDDIISDMNAEPLSSTKACVHPRTDPEDNPQ